MQVFGSAFRGAILALRKAPLLRSGWSMVSGPLKKVERLVRETRTNPVDGTIRPQGGWSLELPLTPKARFSRAVSSAPKVRDYARTNASRKPEKQETQLPPHTQPALLQTLTLPSSQSFRSVWPSCFLF